MNFFLKATLALSLVLAETALASEAGGKVLAKKSMDQKMQTIREEAGPCFSTLQSDAQLGEFAYLQFLPVIYYFSNEELRQEVRQLAKNAQQNCTQFKASMLTFLNTTEDKTVDIETGVKRCSFQSSELEKIVQEISATDFDPSLIFQSLRTVDFDGLGACNLTLSTLKKLQTR